jgi:hypothetical protein
MRKYPSRMGVGASSILLILVVVSLTLFASLALIQARSDASLTDKTDVSVGAFYDADARAQHLIADIDDALKRGLSPDSVEGVSRQGDGIYAFSIGSEDGHTLNVSVNTDGGTCIVTNYRYESAGDWISQNTGTLWQGG